MAERKPTRRCAIYTRKSSEEGLEQTFNSLDAQREACAAYIASQRQEGWREVPIAYDDGGYSGGTLNRPALQQLLADIRSGQVDLIVVYKIDRLTRSLTDFANLVTACRPCNGRKADRTPAEAGMRLRVTPRPPTWAEQTRWALTGGPGKPVPPDWLPFLGALAA